MTLDPYISQHCLQTWQGHQAHLNTLLQVVSIQTLGTKPTDESPTVGELFAQIHRQRLPWIQVVLPSRFHELSKIGRNEALNPFLLKEKLDHSAEMIGDIFAAFSEKDKIKGVPFPPITFLASLINQEAILSGHIFMSLNLLGQAIPDDVLRDLNRWTPPKGV